MNVVTESKYDVTADLVNVPEGFTNYSSVEDDPTPSTNIEARTTEAIKRSLIFDGKQRPRSHDVVIAAMHLLDGMSSGERLVLDISDAFYCLPLLESEKPHHVVRVNRPAGPDYYCCERLSQGTNNAPQEWGCLSALVSRLIISVDAVAIPLKQGQDANVLWTQQSLESRQLWTSVFVIVLRVLGFKLAFKKASLGHEVVWIGACFNFESTQVQVSIKPE
eukprot:3404956-Amphidinium_carterae.1